MDDRTLLELAAKAAEIEIDKSPNNGGGHGNTGFDVAGNAVLDWHHGKMWNPLTDDGDALRLAVKLAIDIKFHFEDGGFVEAWCEAIGDWIEEHDTGKHLSECARRAIVRAAAAIGESK